MSETRAPYYIHVPRLYPQFLVAQYGDAWTVHAFIQSGSALSLSKGGQLAGTNHYLISGPAAELLYLCLAGHRYGTDKSAASLRLAHCARAYLARIAPWPGGYWLAHRVVQHWGPDIWPEMVRPNRERIKR